ncbi:MAG: methionyl-tRNA formyltransferase [Candidatus Paceibacterota bacterium]
MSSSNKNISFAFFGTPPFSVDILDILQQHDLTPNVVVTAPDKPSGRGMKLSPPPVAQWAQKRQIPILQPENINKEFVEKLDELSPDDVWPLFIVVAYGKILPAELIYTPTHNTLNLHPSLLPKLRGPAPIRSAILQEKMTGVTIIELDEQMDHGPIVAQREIRTKNWPPSYPDLKNALMIAGGTLLAETIPAWISGSIQTTTQNDDIATYSQKFSSSDGEINLDDDAERNIRKISAFTDWPKAHFYVEGKRVLITKAHLEDRELVIDRVKPSGDKEISYKNFIKKNQ